MYVSPIERHSESSSVTAEADVESGATEGEKSSAKGDVMPSEEGEKENLRMQKAGGKSVQPLRVRKRFFVMQ